LGVKPLHLRGIAYAQNVIRLGLSTRRTEDGLGELARGVDLVMQARAAVEQFDQELRLRAVFCHVRGAEKIFRIAREQLGEIARRGVVANTHQGDPGWSRKLKAES